MEIMGVQLLFKSLRLKHIELKLMKQYTKDQNKYLKNHK